MAQAGSVGQGGSAAQGGTTAGGSGAAGGGAGGGTPGPVGPRFIGRFDFSTPATPAFAWSGTAISLRFRNTQIGVTLSDGGNNVFEVVIDGVHSQLTTTSGANHYTLATGLTDAPHEVLLQRRTEAFWGETQFHGYDVDQTRLLPGAPVPTRRLEVIGDSISAGYGNEGALPCMFEAKTENQYLTYAAIAARALQADLHSEAWSGIGMLRNNGGETTGTMPERYARTLPERADSVWDFSKYVPHAVVINLATNDFAKGDPGAPFQSTYLKFVADLRGHYPAARFFLAVGTMLSGPDYAKTVTYLKAVIAARAAVGDSNLTLLELGSQDGQADGLGCDYHPSLKTHQKMADKLVAALKADLGW